MTEQFSGFIGQEIVSYKALSFSNLVLQKGQELSESLNPKLFAILGTSFNKPDVSAGFFNIPDMSNRVGMGTQILGSSLDSNQHGSNSIELSTNQLPIHSHAQTVSGDDAITDEPGIPALTSEDSYRPTNNPGDLVSTVPTADTGNGEPIDITPASINKFYYIVTD